MLMKQLGFHHRPDGLWCDGVRLSDIADAFETPCYVYSLARLDFQLGRFARAFEGLNVLPCYAAKANNNPEILRRIANHPKLPWGMDAVSGGELKVGLDAGFAAERMLFSGVGKKDTELEFALKHAIVINIESLFELESIIAIAKLRGLRARIGLRVNPDVDAHTHPKISTGQKRNKFGLSASMLDAALGRINEASECIHLAGISTHIGSQITDVCAWKTAALYLVKLADSFHTSGHKTLEFIDFGGGFPVRYEGDAEPPSIEAFAEIIRSALQNCQTTATKRLRIVVEPGRWLTAEFGGLLTRVIGVKDHFIVVDASMTELIRPALYDARHEIVFENNLSFPEEGQRFDVVGPVCESSDVLVQNICLKNVPKKNQLAVVLQAGAYGFSMASNYNLRPLPPEILITGDQMTVIRQRQKA